MEKWHRPVLLKEVLEYSGKIEGAKVADFTFGEGGHSEAFLERGALRVDALDRDSEALARYRGAGKFANDPRLNLLHGPFSKCSELLKDKDYDIILMDLGVSTRQLLQPDRGFSFQKEGPLDMRMDTSSGPTLAELLDSTEEEDLANALYQYGEIRTSRSLARKILQRWQEGSLKSTLDLASLMGPRRPGKSHPATTLFMALRMAVNEELSEIRVAIPAALGKLRIGGRLLVITFHSVEDRLVKRTFQLDAGRCICSERICACPRIAKVKILTPKPVAPSDAEQENNPRSRSALLRCVEKTLPQG
jgi:16S rRNA (cytosine1402-N4)-methyltransferase